MKNCPICGAEPASVLKFKCGTVTITRSSEYHVTFECVIAAQVKLATAHSRIFSLTVAGDELCELARRADDDIREHLQVANYNLHGQLNTGERVKPPNPPLTVHQFGIDISQAIRKKLNFAINRWQKVKGEK